MRDYADLIRLCKSLSPNEARSISDFGVRRDIRLTVHKDGEFEMVSMTATSALGRCWTTDIAIEESELEETLDDIYNGRFSDVNKRYFGDEDYV